MYFFATLLRFVHDVELALLADSATAPSPPPRTAAMSLGIAVSKRIAAAATTTQARSVELVHHCTRRERNQMSGLRNPTV